MLTVLLLSLSFLSGVYVGARYSGKLIAIWHSITGK
jgi:TctA family transporter